MRVSAKADYAVRAALELAAADGGPAKGERIAEAQDKLPAGVKRLTREPDAWVRR